MAKEIKRIVIQSGTQEWELAAASDTVAPNSVNSDSIVDGSIRGEDLSDEVKDKIQKTYIEEDETLMMDYDVQGSANGGSGNGSTPSAPVIDGDGDVDDEL